MGPVGLLAALLVGACVGWLAWRRGGESPSLAVWSLRLGAVACLGVAAWGGSVRGPQARRARVLVVDRSRSVELGRGRTARLARAALADLGADDFAALVLSGREPVVGLDWRPVATARDRLRAALSQPLDPWGSDLGAALALAGELCARAPGTAEVLLLSDGRDTGGGARAAAAALGVPLHTLAPELPSPRGARLVRLDAPRRVAPGERARVRVVAEALGPGPLTVHLRCGAQNLPPLRREATAGQAVVATWHTPPLRGGAQRLHAWVVSPGDPAPEDDALDAEVLVGEARRVLRVGPPVGLGAEEVSLGALARRLEGTPPELLVLHDVPSARLASAAPALRRAVDAGMGLAVVGTKGIFGAGDAADSPLGELLPVTAGPGSERERPLFVAVVLDASGSMAGDAPSPYAQAVDAALPTALLRPEDRLGAVVFADRVREVFPLAPPTAGLRARLLEIEPGGATDVGAGLARALALLDVPQEAERRLILATDSEDPRPTRHEARLRERARALDGRRARALLVRVGPGPVDSLQTLAAFLRPHVEVEVRHAADAGPALEALTEGELLEGRAALRRGAFRALPTPAGRARRLPLPARIAAYAPTRIREEVGVGAELLARVDDDELGDPPLAVLGRWGGGRTLALPVPAAVAAPLLASLRDELLPAPSEVALAVERDGSLVRARVRAPTALPPGVRLRLAGEGTAPVEAPLLPVSPRRLRATLPAPTRRALRAALVDASGRVLASAGVPDAAHQELASPGVDVALLADLSEATGGRVLAAPPSPERPLPPPPQAEGRWFLAPPAALAALLLVLAESAAGAATLRRHPSTATRGVDGKAPAGR
ncbi:MAG: VWA domain-containing protein [Planctomycetota bacterium]|nr:MAG: VWA domain-containing protein [Planctomycetota bacterium]